MSLLVPHECITCGSQRGPWIFSNWIYWQLWVARQKCWELNPYPLQDWQVFFIRKWSVQPLFSVYLGTVVLTVTRVHLAILAEHDCEASLGNSSIHASYTYTHLLLAWDLSVTPGKRLFSFQHEAEENEIYSREVASLSAPGECGKFTWLKKIFKKCKWVEERLLSSQDLKARSMMEGKAHWQECEVAGYISPTCRKDAAAQIIFSFLFSPGLQPLGWQHSYWQVCLLTSDKPSCKHHRHAQRFVF